MVLGPAALAYERVRHLQAVGAAKDAAVGARVKQAVNGVSALACNLTRYLKQLTYSFAVKHIHQGLEVQEQVSRRLQFMQHAVGVRPGCWAACRTQTVPKVWETSRTSLQHMQ